MSRALQSVLFAVGADGGRAYDDQVVGDALALLALGLKEEGLPPALSGLAADLEARLAAGAPLPVLPDPLIVALDQVLKEGLAGHGAKARMASRERFAKLSAQSGRALPGTPTEGQPVRPWSRLGLGAWEGDRS